MTDIVYEFSRPFNADRLNVDAPRSENISANDDERAALCKRLGLISLSKLTAAMTLTRLPDDPAVIAVEGQLNAVVEQPCVVTMEPVPDTINEPFDTLFASTAYVQKWLDEHPDDDLDAPEELDHGYIDLGELVAQYLSLALDPYPRKAGLEFKDDTDVLKEEHKKESPFAVLSVLKDKK